MENKNISNSFFKTIEKYKEKNDKNGFLKAIYKKDEFAIAICNIVNYKFENIDLKPYLDNITKQLKLEL